MRVFHKKLPKIAGNKIKVKCSYCGGIYPINQLSIVTALTGSWLSCKHCGQADEPNYLKHRVAHGPDII